MQPEGEAAAQVQPECEAAVAAQVQPECEAAAAAQVRAECEAAVAAQVEPECEAAAQAQPECEAAVAAQVQAALGTSSCSPDALLLHICQLLEKCIFIGCFFGRCFEACVELGYQ